jgi:hypothetical protein
MVTWRLESPAVVGLASPAALLRPSSATFSCGPPLLFFPSEQRNTNGLVSSGLVSVTVGSVQPGRERERLVCLVYR